MRPHQRQYEVNGKAVDIETLRNLIINLIDDNPLTIPEIASQLKANARKVQGIVYNLHSQGVISADESNKFHLYWKTKVPMLQDIFHPMPDFSGRIKSIYIHTEEEANAHGQT
jgi:predicted transcriptional regulator